MYIQGASGGLLSVQEKEGQHRAIGAIVGTDSPGTCMFNVITPNRALFIQAVTGCVNSEQKDDKYEIKCLRNKIEEFNGGPASQKIQIEHAHQSIFQPIFTYSMSAQTVYIQIRYPFRFRAK